MTNMHHDRLAHIPSRVDRPLIFLTACTKDRHAVLACDQAHRVLTEIWRESQYRNGWFVGRFVIMPDHVHLFARASGNALSLGRWMQLWKSLSSRQLRLTIGLEGSLWQRDYFDRYLRGHENYGDKWAYVRANPVRAGLVGKVDDWPYQGEIVDLAF